MPERTVDFLGFPRGKEIFACFQSLADAGNMCHAAWSGGTRDGTWGPGAERSQGEA